MKNAILLRLLAAILGSLKPEMLRAIADKILDWVEDSVAESENQIDDKVVLPLVKIARVTFNIPDGDD